MEAVFILEEKRIEKQIIVRLYGCNIDKLKAVVRKIAAMPNVEPQLFGVDNEYIVAITAQSGGEAASEALCESAAATIEAEMGEDVYGRGEASLAHAAAGALIRSGAQLCAAEEKLGLLLEEEFKTTKRAEHIFDFGEYTYRNKRGKKLKLSQKTIDENGEYSLAAASELASRARKAANVQYGAALTEQAHDGMRWIAVADKNQVYARQLQPGESARAGALAVLDLVRRLAENPVLTSATIPVRQKAKLKANKLAIAAATASLLFSVLAAGGMYYAYDKYYIPNQPDEQVTQAFK